MRKESVLDRGLRMCLDNSARVSCLDRNRDPAVKQGTRVGTVRTSTAVHASVSDMV